MMQHTMKISKILIIAVVLVSLQGCAIFPKNMVKPYSDFSNANQSGEKTKIFLTAS